MMKPMAKLITVLVVFICVFSVSAAVFAQETKPYHFGYKPGRDGKLPSIAQEGFMEVLQRHGAVFLGNTEKKVLYLTFDNGYENGCTSKILDVLKEKNVPAAFFVTGHYAKSQAELLKRMVNEGHLIGNHSWSHPDMTQISVTRMKDELEKVKQEVTKVTGQREMSFARPPRGIFNDQVLAVSRELGYTSVFWSLAYVDWDITQQKGWRHAYEKVTKQLHPGAVILLHSVSIDNAEALGKIIDDARRQGYEFKSLNQLDVKQYR